MITTINNVCRQIWNALPDSVVSESSIDSFRH